MSAKLRAAKLGNAPATKEEGEQEEGEGAEGGDAKAPRKTGPAAGAPPADVHDAAKKGDVEALKAFLEQEGASVNSKVRAHTRRGAALTSSGTRASGVGAAAI